MYEDAFGVFRPDMVEKRFVPQKERKRLQHKGHAMQPLKGSDQPRYPIKNTTDLKNAKRAIGRAKPGKRAGVIRHINEEAERLGAAKVGTSKSLASGPLAESLAPRMIDGLPDMAFHDPGVGERGDWDITKTSTPPSTLSPGARAAFSALRARGDGTVSEY